MRNTPILMALLLLALPLRGFGGEESLQVEEWSRADAEVEERSGAGAEVEESLSANAEVEEILSADPEAGDYVKSRRCLPTGRIRSATALDDRHIVFRVSRTERYLVQLPRRCPGLRREDTIAYETTSSMSLCRGDTIRGTFAYGAGSRRLGPRCTLANFQRITREQLELLRESLKQARWR